MSKNSKKPGRTTTQVESRPSKWEHEESVADEQQSIEGVGRAGSPLRSLEFPGLSEKTASQIREVGSDRLRISRAGSDLPAFESPKVKVKKRGRDP